MLETLAPGLREVGTIGSFAVGSELCAIDCGDVDGDGAAELMLAYSAGEKDLLRPRIRVELTSFAKGMRRSEIRLPEAPEVFHLQLVDINGDGRSEILRYRRGASRETIAEAYSVSSAGQASDRPVFCDTFIDGDPVVIVAAELDENPGNELVVFCAPNRRETLWYTASEAGAYPDARTRRTFDPLLESTETDVAVAHVIGDSRTPGSPLLVVGTTGHSLFEIRSYSVSHGAVALRGSLPRGRVMGICGGPDGSVLYSVSTTRLDPKLPRELDRDWIARNAIGGVRMVADGSFHWLDDVVIPRSPFQENLATDWCELRGLAAWSKPAPGSQIFGATAIGFAACSRFDTVPTTNLALCDLATGEAAALAIPTLMKIGDLDGDGDAEVVAISGQKVLVAGLAQCDVPRVGSWPEIESQFEMRRWLALLRGCVEGTPDRSEYERMGGPWQAGIETRVDAEFTTGRCRSAKERDFGMELGAVPIECPPKCLSGKARQIEIREDRHVAEYIALTPSDAAGDGFTYEAEFSLPEMEYGSVVRFGLFDQAGPRVALKFSHHRIPTVRPGSRHALQVDVPPNSVVCNRVATDRPFEEDLWYRLSIRGRISDGVSIVELRALDHPRDEAPEVQAVVELPAIQRGELRAGFEGWNENPAAGGRARLLLRRLAVSQWELP